MTPVTQQRANESEVNQDVSRNVIPMTIDGTIYLVGLHFSKDTTHTIDDCVKALIYKDFQEEKAICQRPKTVMKSRACRSEPGVD